jgi:hypothetical protein
MANTSCPASRDKLTLRSQLIIQLSHDPQIRIPRPFKLLCPALDESQRLFLHGRDSRLHGVSPSAI